MTRLSKLSIVVAVLAAGVAGGPAAAHGPIRTADAAAEAAHRADRAEILAMAGNYKVRFDMQETTPWQAGYQPLDRKISGGHEVVRVIEDSPQRIVLQHLLVVGEPGKASVIKHWRQDWEWAPAQVLAYAGKGRWQWEAVPAAMRAGRWSQTVYQVDDSPRYAGWGQFETQGGVRRWRSNWTWRPLARRDAIRNPVYDRYFAINRHQPTPGGWLHWQDNTKMASVDGKIVPIVQESVLNTYTRFDDYDVKAADDYWALTSQYWAAVRAAWARVAATRGGIAIAEEAQTGTVISARLLSMGDDVAAGTRTAEAAEKEAAALIEANTGAIDVVATPQPAS